MALGQHIRPDSRCGRGRSPDLRRGGGVAETFTVRKISSGIGVERTFPVNSPSIAKIEVVKRGKVRRNKITYIRKLSGKAARIKTRD